MTDTGKPRDSGLDHTLAAEEASDETLPAPLSERLSERTSEKPGESVPPPRASRVSIPPLPTQRYRLGNEIGRGGMGRVVEAFDTQLGRTVALKEVLPQGGSVVRRFLREIEITARLEHASIVPLYDSGTTADGRPYYVMKRVTGRPLDEEIRRAPSLDERLTLLPAMLAAIDAIAHAHDRGVIHRDLKPSNILVGELGQTTVIDWGLAKVIGEVEKDEASDAIAPSPDGLHTQMGSVFGTPGFMSPEQARGEELTPTVDVYALGATLYQLLAGKPPLGGTSVTELIGKTLVHDVTPLAQVVDGVPKELVAIVDKALSFEAGVRYRNAGELAADVRRFQAGQLVAAHQYTAGQRVAKFARRNRAVLIVIAAALAAMTVFGVFSVRSILVERDAAHSARAHALAEKQAAEEARDRLAERNDALTLTRARALLETNPTQALLTAAAIDPRSPRAGDARAVAQSAVMSGVWWGMAGPDEWSVRLELDTDGTQLLQLTTDGTVRVWDLDRKRIVLARTYPRDAGAAWAGERVIVWRPGAPAELLEPAANRSVPLAGPSLSWVEVSDAGDVALAIETKTKDGGRAVLIDPATGARTSLWDGHLVTSATLAHDGSWMILRDDETIAVFDRAGTLLTRYPDNELAMVAMSRTRRAMFNDTTALVELVLDPVPVWKTITLPSDATRLHGLGYRGDNYDFVANVSVHHVTRTDGVAVATGHRFDGVQFPTTRGARDVNMLPTQRGLLLFGELVQRVIPIPVALSTPKFVSRYGVSRVVMVGKGGIIGLELDDVIPARVPTDAMANRLLFDIATVLEWGGYDNVKWTDIPSKKTVKVDTTIIGSPMSVDAVGGRALFTELATNTPERRSYLVRKNQAAIEPITSGADPLALLIPGDAVVYTPSPGEPLVARFADGTEKPLPPLGSDVIAMAPLGHLAVAVLGSDGTLMRGNASTGVFERASVMQGASMYIATDRKALVAIGVEHRLFVWGEGPVTEVATFAKPILTVDVLPDGAAVVVTTDFAAMRVPLVARATPQQLLTSTVAPAVDGRGSRLAGINMQNETEVVDLATSSRWTVPKVYGGVRVQSLGLTADGSAAVESLGGWMVLRELPAADADLGSWARERSNAKLVDDALVWPWQ